MTTQITPINCSAPTHKLAALVAALRDCAEQASLTATTLRLVGAAPSLAVRAEQLERESTEWLALASAELQSRVTTLKYADHIE